MTPSGTALAIGILRDAYPRAEFPDRTVAVYTEALADLDDRAVVEAVRGLLAESKYLPSIAEIREEVAEAILDLPSPEQAWSMVSDPGTKGKLPTLVLSALQEIGGRHTVRASEQPYLTRKQFMEIYGSRRRLAVREIVRGRSLSPTLAALPESEQIQPRTIDA
jgi:hypothetical protein